ncbi:MAG TPA: hypothetical protein PK156_48695, partial [Polyangium sp.]|nr:hypothetical protein [Polyangium sp.]
MTKRPLLHSGTYTLGLVASISVATALSGASCSDPPKTTDTSSTSSSSSGMGGEGGGASSSTGGMGVGGEGGFNPGVCPCTDFPADPVFLDGLTPDVHTAITGTPPTMELGCISEPAPDAMVPRNWTPLLIEFSPALGQNVYQIKLEVDNQINPLVVYTTKYSYTMPTAMWTSLTSHSAGHDVKISVTTMKWENGAIVEGPYNSAPSTLHIAPIDAPGSIVYWGHNPGNNEITIRGFTVGDLTPKVVLSNAVAGTNSGGKVTGCMSCHASSPDGQLMFYSSSDPPDYYRC